MILAANPYGVLAADGGSLGAGFIAFLVVLALAVAAFFLFRSMNRHLRNVPEAFNPPTGDSPTGAPHDGSPPPPEPEGSAAAGRESQG